MKGGCQEVFLGRGGKGYHRLIFICCDELAEAAEFAGGQLFGVLMQPNRFILRPFFGDSTAQTSQG